MKKTILFCLVILSTSLSAQWVKDSYYASARFGLSAGSYASALGFGLDLEKALTKGKDMYGPGSIGAGIGFDISLVPEQSSGSGTSNYSYYFLSLYGTYNFGPMMDDKRIDPYFLIGFAPYMLHITKTDLLNRTTASNDFDVEFVGAFGLRFSLSQQWALHARLGFGASVLTVGAQYTI